MNEQTSFEGEWQVSKMVNLDQLNMAPTLTIDSDKISGNAGCNNYSASFTLEEGNIQVGPVMATKMFCTHMKIEDAFFECLKNTTLYELKDGTLTMYSKDNKVLLTCVKTKG